MYCGLRYVSVLKVGVLLIFIPRYLHQKNTLHNHTVTPHPIVFRLAQNILHIPESVTA